MVVDILISQEGSVTDRLLPLPEEGKGGHELWARLPAIALIIASSVTIQIFVNRSERARERLRESEDHHRAVVDTAPDAIITMPQDRLIRFFNPGAESIFGYAAGEVVGKPLKILMPERFREVHKKGFRRYLETGETQLLGKGPVELAGLRKSGEEFPLELTLGETRQNGGLLFTGIIRDITERRQAELEIRKLNGELEEQVQELTVQLEVSVSELEDTLAKHSARSRGRGS